MYIERGVSKAKAQMECSKFDMQIQLTFGSVILSR